MDAYKVRSSILFLVFNRPDWTWQTFDRIRRARPKRLFIAADGPRPEVAADGDNCRRVINIVNDIDWDCEVKQCFRDRNLGCKQAVSSAIRWFFEEVEEGIILEDDCVPNNSFFSFCDAMLEHYRHDSSIMHVAGTNYQFGRRRGPASYYFSRYPHIWGWGTWRRAWNLYDLEMSDYAHFKASGELTKIISNPWERQFWLQPFDMCYDNRIDTWDYQWTYTLFKNRGLAVMPTVNLVSNIGFGSEATHTKVESQVTAMATEELEEIIHPERVEIDSRADGFTMDYNLSGRFQRLFLPGISNLINICMIESRRWGHTSAVLDELFWNEGKIASMSVEDREKFRQLVPKLNNDAHMHYWYGLICLKDGWPEKATREFDRARELGLTHWRVDWCAARAACLEGRIDDGERFLEKVLKNAPDFARTLCFNKKIARDTAKRNASGQDENGKDSTQKILQALIERRKPSSKNLIKSCSALKVPRNSTTCEKLFTVSRPKSDELTPEKRLNIVHIGTLERSGGAARVAWRLAKAQLSAGHDAKLLVGRRESDAEFCEELDVQIAINLATEYRRQGLLYYEFQGSHFLPEHPLVKAADIIHLHNLHGNYFNPFSLLLLGRWKPVVWTLHDMQALTGHCAHSLDCERWRHGCGECSYLLTYPAVEVDQTARLWADKKQIYDHVPFQTTAPSSWLADKTREGAIDRHPARVIPNGVDTEVFVPHDKKSARRRLGLPLNGFITGGVAHGGVLANGWKGGQYSLEAFNVLLGRYPDSYYVSVGGNEYYTEWDGHLINLPSVEEESDLAWVYSALDLYLMTSTAESFSLVIVEAMACGVPVLAFATGGVPELVTSGVNGLVVGYLNQPALNEALLSLAANPQVLALMAANTRETSCRYYDHRLVTGWYEHLYHEYRRRWPFELGRFPRLSFPAIPQPVRTEPFIRALQRIPNENYENPQIPDSASKENTCYQ